MMLKGKSVVITGAGRGIGREIALLMAKQGARVVVNDYGGSAAGLGGEKTPADEVVDEIRRAGGEAAANYDSVATMAGGQAIVKTALDAFGRVDIVVNNAGILRDRMIFNMSEEEWDAVINTHLKGTFAVTRAAAPIMREQKGGRVINMTSTSGLIGNVGQANYAAAKLGILGLTKATALDMARYNVTANCISPFAWTTPRAGHRRASPRCSRAPSSTTWCRSSRRASTSTTTRWSEPRVAGRRRHDRTHARDGRNGGAGGPGQGARAPRADDRHRGGRGRTPGAERARRRHRLRQPRD